MITAAKIQNERSNRHKRVRLFLPLILGVSICCYAGLTIQSFDLQQRKEELRQSAQEDVNSKLRKFSKHVNSLPKEYEMIEAAKQEIQRADRQSVLDEFGEGPYRVEIELDFPPDSPMSDLPSPPTKFVIELAPLDLMPHSVHLFLAMVRNKLWDGCSFMRNAGHVIQAGSTPYYKNKGMQQQLVQAFRESGLKSVVFQEYHESFPHVAYTVGFAGRPGGPDFYVSLIDNTRNHGPGGQVAYDHPTEADPCFGKVVEGFDAIDRMHMMPVKPGGFQGMVNNVGIAYARVLDITNAI
jgi:cyclophilin family peptidyl-prolyl cis-trans isomerase